MKKKINGKFLYQLQNELYNTSIAIEQIFEARNKSQEMTEKAISKYNECLLRVAELNLKAISNEQ